MSKEEFVNEDRLQIGIEHDSQGPHQEQ